MLAESTNNPHSQWNEHLLPALESTFIKLIKGFILNKKWVRCFAPIYK